MRLTSLESEASRRLGVPLVLVQSDAPVNPARLSEGEARCLRRLSRERRRLDWLRGRDALKQVLGALSCDSDTSAIGFPHARLSLTHSGGVALAIGTTAAVSGMGIDYEPMRRRHPGIARWLLHDAETAWLEAAGAHDPDAMLLRLWTAKEAAFKSHPRNAGMSLRDFRLSDARLLATDVRADRGDYGMRVTCFDHRSGYVSVAVCSRGAAFTPSISTTSSRRQMAP